MKDKAMSVVQNLRTGSQVGGRGFSASSHQAYSQCTTGLSGGAMISSKASSASASSSTSPITALRVAGNARHWSSGEGRGGRIGASVGGAHMLSPRTM